MLACTKHTGGGGVEAITDCSLLTHLFILHFLYIYVPAILVHPLDLPPHLDDYLCLHGTRSNLSTPNSRVFMIASIYTLVILRPYVTEFDKTRLRRTKLC